MTSCFYYRRATATDARFIFFFFHRAFDLLIAVVQQIKNATEITPALKDNPLIITSSSVNPS